MKRVLIPLIRGMRPEHWVKNSFDFTALVFSGSFARPGKYLPAILAFVAFCLGSSSAYLINDVLDCTMDQVHPLKRMRPVASRQLGKAHAVLASVPLMFTALAVSFGINTRTGWGVLLYCLLTYGYSLVLKQIPLVDIAAIAMGFVLRAYAGATAIGVYPSPWLLMCSFLLASFLALSKRYHELLTLGENSAAHRKSLSHYSKNSLLVLMFSCAAATMSLYVVYTLQPSTVRQVEGPALVFTTPFVAYGLLLYLRLVLKQGGGGRPVNVFLTDFRLMLSVAAWGISSALIIFLASASSN